MSAFKERIRKYFWTALGPPISDSKAPIGIDQTLQLPLHYEPPECPICTFDEFQCHDCGGTIIDPEAPFGVGVESVTFTHMHVHSQVGPHATGREIRVPARRKLCLKCFRIDWAKANPGKPCDL